MKKAKVFIAFLLVITVLGIDASAQTIQDIRVSNHTSAAAVVSWTTDVDTTINLVHYEDPITGWQTAEDTTVDNVHWVQISGLTALTTYNYSVESDGVVDDNGGAYYQFTTVMAGGGTLYFLIGTVFLQDGVTPASRVISYVTVTHGGVTSAYLSVLSTDAPQSNWNVNLGNLKNPNTGDVLSWALGDAVNIEVHGAQEGTGSASDVLTGSPQFAPDITIGPDWIGPIVSSTAIFPDPASGPVTLTATVDDTTTGESNVAAAEYFLDVMGTKGNGTLMTPADGTFDSPTENVTLTIDTSVWPDGFHTLYVGGQDVAGNWSDTYDTVTLTTDNTGPYVTGALASPNPAKTSTITLTAMVNDTTSNVAAAEYFIDTMGTPGTGTPMAPVDGAFDSLTEDVEATVDISGLSEGDHTFYVGGKDELENWTGTYAEVDLVIDRIPPLTSNAAVSPNPANYSTTLTATIEDVGSTNIIAAEYFIDAMGTKGTGTPMDPADGSWDSSKEDVTADVDITDLSEGYHTFYVGGKDSAGNWTKDYAPVVLVVDRTPPLASDAQANPNPANTSPITLTATIQDVGSTNIIAAEYFIDEEPTEATKGTGKEMYPEDGLWNSTTEDVTKDVDISELSEGDHIIYVGGQDAAGNWTDTYAEVDLKKDTTSPSADNANVYPDPANYSTTLTATIQDVVGTDIIAAEYFIDTMGDPGTGKEMYPADGLWNSTTEDVTKDVDISGLSEGYHGFYVGGQDSAGNWTEKEYYSGVVLYIDRTPPVTSNVDADPNPTLGFTLVSLIATIQDNGGIDIAAAEYFIDTPGADGTGTPMTASDGAFDSTTEDVEADVDVTVLSEDTHTIYVHGMDLAGNWGAFDTVDLVATHAPEISEITVSNHTSSSVVISWITDIPSDAIVHYGSTPSLGSTAEDVRFDDTHWVQINGLTPYTDYYYEVVSGATVDDNSGVYYQFKSAKIGAGTPYTIYGGVAKVEVLGGQVSLDSTVPAEGAIVYAIVEHDGIMSAPLSTLTANNGSWSLNLADLKNPNTGEVLPYADGDLLVVYAQGVADGRLVKITEVSGLSPQVSGLSPQNVGLITLIHDVEAPVVSNVSATFDGKTNTITLTATIDDTNTGGSNIIWTEYVVEGPIVASVSNFIIGTPMLPADGAFNSPWEEVTADIDVSNEETWPDGDYIVSVRGLDAAASVGTDSTTLEIRRVVEFEISLKTGLNLIALPADLVEPKTSFTLIPHIGSGICTAVSKWDKELQQWMDAILIPGFGIIGDNFPITIGEGYFLLVTADTSYIDTGKQIGDPVTLEMKTGLNLVGMPYPSEAEPPVPTGYTGYTSFTLIPAIGSEICTAVSMWDKNLQQWKDAIEVLAPEPIVIGEDFDIVNDEGYFLLLTQDQTWAPEVPTGISVAQAAPKMINEASITPLYSEANSSLSSLSGITESNLSSSSITISWTADAPSDGVVLYGPTPSFGQEARSIAQGSYIHWARLAGLADDTVYYYKVVSDNSGKLYSFRTPSVRLSPNPPHLLYGKVEIDGTPNEGVIVYAKMGNDDGASETISTVTGKNGTWLLNLGNFKGDVKAGDNLLLEADGGILGYVRRDVSVENLESSQDIGILTLLPSSLKEKQSIPKESTLLQNYPNPFNPETWIPFELSNGCDVVIKIYSATGQLVRELDLGYKEAGRYTAIDKTAHWDGANSAGEKVSSGVYFYQLHAGSFVSTKKMVILK